MQDISFIIYTDESQTKWISRVWTTHSWPLQILSSVVGRRSMEIQTPHIPAPLSEVRNFPLDISRFFDFTCLDQIYDIYQSTIYISTQSESLRLGTTDSPDERFNSFRTGDIQFFLDAGWKEHTEDEED
jgi:hypothetical protein